MSSLSLIDSLMLAFWSPGPGEMMVLAVVALLLYGGKLPEVARSWGKSFAEFRRGLSGFQSELNSVIYSEPERITYHQENLRNDASMDQGYQVSEYDEDPEVIAEENSNESTEESTVAVKADEEASAGADEEANEKVGEKVGEEANEEANGEANDGLEQDNEEKPAN